MEYRNKLTGIHEYHNNLSTVHIVAHEIEIDEGVIFGDNIDIKVRGTFRVGKNSRIGNRFKANAEEIIIGDYFFNEPTDSRGMVIGGGSSNFPFAKLKIGDRCVCHTGHINLAKPVTIGNDVGLSHDVDILTHGFWDSALEGFPRIFKPVTIGNNVIIGWKTIILPGVLIGNEVVVGAGSVVTKNLIATGIYGGNPARPIKDISINKVQQIWIEDQIKDEWNELMSYYEQEYKLDFNLPTIKINKLIINVENKHCEGEHDAVTDAFRDFLRRWGIRIFHERGFKFNLTRKQ